MLTVIVVIAFILLCYAVSKLGSIRTRLTKAAENADNKYDRDGYIQLQNQIDKGKGAGTGFF